MRKLSRCDEPDILRENAARWTENYLHRKREDHAARFYWPDLKDGNCYQQIRAALGGITQNHCAFCDGPLGLESRETVEHFRPKSKFPELAYVWANLFPCCDICQSNKLEKFDEDLLKPDEHGYLFSAYFIVNHRTGAIEPSPQAIQSDQRRAVVTHDMYGLNSPVRKRARLRELENYQLRENPILDDFNYRFFLEP